MISQQRLTSDLVWCLRSPPLIRRDGDDVWPTDRWFRELDPGRPGPLPAPRHPHRFRLGLHFERLLIAWLQSQQDKHLRDTNLQVQERKRTVGEFDLLVDVGASTWHWEVAVKFYMGRGDTRAMHAWYGPNTADRFDLKFQRLIDHQLRLAEHPAAQRLLAGREIGIDRVICFMKGRLFHPWDAYHEARMVFPADVNPEHEKGWWVSLEHFPAVAPADQRYVVLQKINWLSPVTPDDALPALSLPETVAHLQGPNIEQATHLAIVDEQGREISRGFVVTDEWLARTATP